MATHTRHDACEVQADSAATGEGHGGIRRMIDRVSHGPMCATVIDLAKRNAGMLAGPVVAAAATKMMGPGAGVVLGFITANAGHFLANYKLAKEGMSCAERLDRVIDQVSILSSEVESMRHGRQGEDAVRSSRDAPMTNSGRD